MLKSLEDQLVGGEWTEWMIEFGEGDFAEIPRSEIILAPGY